MLLDLSHLHDGWMELESDPGLFTLLLEDFGVRGLQVEEIYDLTKPVDEWTHGYILLFRWVEERRARQRQTTENKAELLNNEDQINSIFFAQQVVPNSCATHALVSILLNCSDIDLGPTLANLKLHTQGMCPENKGLAIGNTAELAWAHNRHAAPHAQRVAELRSSAACGPGGLVPGANGCSASGSAASGSSLLHHVSRGGSAGSSVVTTAASSQTEQFHFVSYVPIGGRLFELDGLKPAPIDHGGWSDEEVWTDKFQRVIAERLGVSGGGRSYGGRDSEIRFSLMSVVSDRRISLTRRLTTLKADIWWLYGVKTGMMSEPPRQMSFELAAEASVFTTSTTSAVCNSNSSGSGVDAGDAAGAEKARAAIKQWDWPRLTVVIARLCTEAKQLEDKLKDELEKRKKYKVDASRRRHDYDAFITTYLSMLAAEGLLGDLMQQQIYPNKYRSTQRQSKSNELKNKKRKKYS